ncbi:MAG: CoB--CoM heterodisulfide reductase iron-sulfur subunit A family protein [Thermodesulfobacteriota bacterium]
MTNKKDEKTQAEPRVGVFICDCGSNIAGHIDCPAITEYAATLPGVAFAKENLYSCSEGGIAEIKKAIKENDLERVVVASCSPRTHQPLFSSSCGEAGLNPYLFEMVNIRDQCSWVHMQDREKGTQKAKDLVRMGVAKSKNLEPQEDIESSLVDRVLVIGGGVAGLSAAQTMSGMGLEVILVEKKQELGGNLRYLNQLAPGEQSAAEYIDSLVESVQGDPGITVHLGAEVQTVDGYIGNYQVGLKTADGLSLEEKVGCLVVAIGGVPLTPHGLYSYDRETVISQMELEDKLRNQTFQAGKTVMIQCVGARDEQRAYCSRICCLTAVKNAMLIKKRDPEAEVHILYRDMQMYGTEKEQMLWDARAMGINFHVYDPADKPVVKQGQVTFYHSLLGKEITLDAEQVVLSTPLVAGEDAQRISQMMRVPMDQNKFFLEAHAKLRPLDFSADGIFVCGSARYPATVDEARSQGTGVASRVGTILFKDRLISSAIVAAVDPESCVGCMGCIDVCPYQAISFDPEKKVCVINNILCKGCGSCAATCPSESVQLRGYKPKQLLAQIRAAA